MAGLMKGLMQDNQLLISSIMRYAQQYHSGTAINTSVNAENMHNSTYGQVFYRARQLANALANLGVQQGDCIGSLAWNSYRHLELYYAVPGMGAVLNTINPRLFPEQVSFIVNHAEDKYLFVDLDFLPLVKAVIGDTSGLKAIVVLCSKQEMPDIQWCEAICYEEMLAAQTDEYQWPQFPEETAASLCYTSGTTGDPKGVLYSHRSIVLHSMATCMKDCLNIGSEDSIMPVVPMFHVNAWGIPYSAAIAGSKLVFPGSDMSGKNLYRLLESESCTLSLGVPTIWQALVDYAENEKEELAASLPIKEFVIGGSAASSGLVASLERLFQSEVIHAWGMTETSPLGSISRPSQKHRKTLSEDDLLNIKLTQGRAPFGVEMKIVDESGEELPWDSHASGELMVRGPWVAKAYFKKEATPLLDSHGYFATGDISSISSEGWMSIVDRSKDIIKSGGEWISSLELESIALRHPDILEAAVIGVHHPKWQERPLLICVLKPGAKIEADDVKEFMSDKVVKWWLPDDVVFADVLPRNATGKIHKLKLRELHRGHILPVNRVSREVG